MDGYLMIRRRVARDGRLSRDDLLVYGTIVGWYDNAWGDVEPLDWRTIAEWTGLDEFEIGAAIRRLAEFGWVSLADGVYVVVDPTPERAPIEDEVAS